MTPKTTLTTAELARYTRRGRQLQGRAMRDAFVGAGRWLFRIAAEALGRRATIRLGRGDLGRSGLGRSGLGRSGLGRSDCGAHA